MANYDKKFRMTVAPSAHLDGSGMVAHQIVAIARDSTAAPADPWLVIPGRSKTINVPEDEIVAALTLSTNPQRIAGIKDALRANINTQNVPVTGWTDAALEALLDQNNLAAIAAAAVTEFITVTLGLSFPVDFAIE